MNAVENIKFEVGYFFSNLWDDITSSDPFEIVLGAAIIFTAFVMPVVAWYAIDVKGWLSI